MGDDPWSALRGLRLNAAAETKVAVDIAGTSYLVDTMGVEVHGSAVRVGGDLVVFSDGEAWPVSPCRPPASPMPRP